MKPTLFWPMCYFVLTVRPVRLPRNCLIFASILVPLFSNNPIEIDDQWDALHTVAPPVCRALIIRHFCCLQYKHFSMSATITCSFRSRLQMTHAATASPASRGQTTTAPCAVRSDATDAAVRIALAAAAPISTTPTAASTACWTTSSTARSLV